MKPGKLDREADGCIYDRYLPIWSRKEKSIVGRSKLEAHQSGLVDTYFFSVICRKGDGKFLMHFYDKLASIAGKWCGLVDIPNGGSL